MIVDASGYRAYGVEAIDRMRFIRGAQRLGLTLSDVRALLAVRDAGTCPCEPAEQLPSAECPPPVPGTWCQPACCCDECCDGTCGCGC
jgi:hypothetical protein